MKTLLVFNIFTDWWNGIVSFFMTPDPVYGISNGLRLVLGFVFFLIAWFLLKFIMAMLRKAFKVNQIRVKKKEKTYNPKTKKFETIYVDKDNFAPKYVLSTLDVIFKLIIVFSALGLMGADLTGVATILSSIVVAVGLSLQDFIKNYISGITLLASKNYSAGDYVALNDASYEGTIVEIKALATVLKTPNEEIIYIPNNLVLNTVSKNYEKLPYRRIVIKFSIGYECDPEVVMDTIKKIAAEEVRVVNNDQYGINAYVNALNPAFIEICLACYTLNANYWPTLRDLNKKIFLSLKESNSGKPFLNRPVLINHHIEDKNKNNNKEGQ